MAASPEPREHAVQSTLHVLTLISVEQPPHQLHATMTNTDDTQTMTMQELEDWVFCLDLLKEAKDSEAWPAYIGIVQDYYGAIRQFR